jgi:chemotaxis protein MotB
MASQKPEKPTFIVKRAKKRGSHGGHGGVWKIAYADFVTAMMAFFLLMWLLGSTTKGDLEGIADYFRTPLKVALAGGSGSGDSSSIINGGGTDLSRSAGQVKHGETVAPRRNINLQAARAEVAKHEMQQLRRLQEKVTAALDVKETLKPFRHQIKVDITSDGLRIQIVDEKNRPMFDLGQAVLKDYMREILREIGKVLNTVDYPVSLSGHTDAAQYASGQRGYSNWELSADRANASRRELVAAGMQEKKIVRVVGLASSALANAGDPLDPANRRISIIVLNKQAQEALAQDAAARVGAPRRAAPAAPAQ